MDIKTTKMKRRERKGKAVIVIKSEIFVFRGQFLSHPFVEIGSCGRPR